MGPMGIASSPQAPRHQQGPDDRLIATKAPGLKLKPKGGIFGGIFPLQGTIGFRDIWGYRRIHIPK